MIIVRVLLLPAALFPRRLQHQNNHVHDCFSRVFMIWRYAGIRRDWPRNIRKQTVGRLMTISSAAQSWILPLRFIQFRNVSYVQNHRLRMVSVENPSLWCCQRFHMQQQCQAIKSGQATHVNKIETPPTEENIRVFVLVNKIRHHPDGVLSDVKQLTTRDKWERVTSTPRNANSWFS